MRISLFVVFAAVCMARRPVLKKHPLHSKRHPALDREDSPLGHIGDSEEEVPSSRFLEKDVALLPECQRKCASALAHTFAAAFKLGGDHIKRMKNVCREYENAWACIGRAECGTPQMFSTLTSGIQFMCHEQKRECTRTCQTDSMLVSWALRSLGEHKRKKGSEQGSSGSSSGSGGSYNMLSSLLGMRHSEAVGQVPPNADFSRLHSSRDDETMASRTSEDVRDSGRTMFGGVLARNFGSSFEPDSLETFRQFTAEACEAGECLLECVKNKMNHNCDGSAGTLISEVLMRPIALSQQRLAHLPMGGLFSLLLPQQCAFMFDKHQIERFRIDPSLDRDLKKMYNETALDNLDRGPYDGKDLAPSVAFPESSFDSEKTLDELIRERYGDGTGVESGQEYDKELEKKRQGDYGNDTGSEQIRNGSGLEARVRKEYEGGLGSNDLLISTGEEGSGHQEPLRVIEISGGQDSMKIGKPLSSVEEIILKRVNRSLLKYGEDEEKEVDYEQGDSTILSSGWGPLVEGSGVDSYEEGLVNQIRENISIQRQRFGKNNNGVSEMAETLILYRVLLGVSSGELKHSFEINLMRSGNLSCSIFP